MAAIAKSALTQKSDLGLSAFIVDSIHKRTRCFLPLRDDHRLHKLELI